MLFGMEELKTVFLLREITLELLFGFPYVYIFSANYEDTAFY